SGTAVTGAGTILNSGTISAGRDAIHLSSGDVVNGASNATSAVIESTIGYGIYATAITATNLGTIVSGSNRAIDFLSSGTIVNGASGSTAALIQGVGQAIFSRQGSDATLVNFGTVQGSGTYGAGAFFVLENTVRVANYGTLIGYRYGAVALATAATVTNV